MKLHFFGNGSGESIVIETDRGWGVIDSFMWEGRIPVLEFLKSRGVTSLWFLALTHPHKDHYDGFDDITQHFYAHGGILEFWRYPAVDWQFMYPVLKRRAEAKYDPFKKKELESLAGLEAAFDRLVDRVKKGATEVKNCQLLFPLVVDTAGLKIEAIAPPSQRIIEAQTVMLEALRRDTIGEEQRRWDLNQLSSAFLVTLGATQVLLGGDVTARAWDEVFASSSCPSLAPAILKVSHHGSKTDNPVRILEKLSDPPKRRLAVVTRYSSKNLPRHEVLENLRARFDEVIVLGTQQTGAIRRSTGNPVHKPATYNVERLQVDISASDIVVHPKQVC